MSFRQYTLILLSKLFEVVEIKALNAITGKYTKNKK